MAKIRQVYGESNFAKPFGCFSPVTTKKTSLFVIIFGLVIWSMCDTVIVDAAKTPSPVYVNKCCRVGEKLEQNKECSLGGTIKWWPVIWLIMKNAYFEPHGEAPRFFKVNESTRPQCKSPELVNGEHTMAVFSNGTLYLPDRAAVIESVNFCVDKDGDITRALVCPNSQNADLINETVNRTRVRKCCTEKQMYQNEAGCVDGHNVTKRKLIENSTNPIEYRYYAFPQCSKNINNNPIAIIGKFNESTFDESTGNLTLAEGTFQSDQYCLEHINDTGTVNVHVFTCTEYLPTSDKTEKVS